MKAGDVFVVSAVETWLRHRLLLGQLLLPLMTVAGLVEVMGRLGRAARLRGGLGLAVRLVVALGILVHWPGTGVLYSALGGPALEAAFRVDLGSRESWDGLGELARQHWASQIDRSARLLALESDEPGPGLVRAAVAALPSFGLASLAGTLALARLAACGLYLGGPVVVALGLRRRTTVLRWWARTILAVALWPLFTIAWVDLVAGLAPRMIQLDLRGDLGVQALVLGGTLGAVSLIAPATAWGVSTLLYLGVEGALRALAGATREPRPAQGRAPRRAPKASVTAPGRPPAVAAHPAPKEGARPRATPFDSIEVPVALDASISPPSAPSPRALATPGEGISAPPYPGLRARVAKETPDAFERPAGPSLPPPLPRIERKRAAVVITPAPVDRRALPSRGG